MSDGHISSYSSPFNFGHKALAQLFDGEVYAQEKVDGSQFSFSLREEGLLARSRKQDIIVSEADTSMFAPALKTILELVEELRPDWTYRGEFLAKPKHNTLVYDRVPAGNIVLFDVDMGDQDYLLPEYAAQEAQRLGLEFVPTLAIYAAKPTMAALGELLATKSMLGNVGIEGVVLKNYAQFGVDKKVLMGKYVAEAFKEKHSGDWKQRNPTQADVVLKLIDEFSTEAIWRKAIQHMKEQGQIEGVVQDIPILLKEIGQDVLREHGDEIRERLFKFFWPKIQRGITHGLPEFYKRLLLEEFLGGEE